MAPVSSPAASSSHSDVEEKHLNGDDVYDPDQDPAEKRATRRGLRTIAGEIEETRHDLENAKIEDIHRQLDRLDGLFPKVKDTAEAVLDSKNLMHISETAANKAKMMKSDVGSFDVDDFISKLVTSMGGRRGGMKERDQSESVDQDDDEDDTEDVSSVLDWSKVGRLSLGKSHRVPVINLMLGPLSTEQKQRKKVVRAKFEKNKEIERAPQQLNEEDLTANQNETTSNVKMVQEKLEEVGPINLFRFITNPYDFGQSVENLFYLSFLIRDGKCAFEFNEETEEPTIFSCEEPSADDYNQDVKKRQIVLELDTETWKYAIEVFSITECIIPDRPKIQKPVAAKL